MRSETEAAPVGYLAGVANRDGVAPKLVPITRGVSPATPKGNEP